MLGRICHVVTESDSQDSDAAFPEENNVAVDDDAIVTIEESQRRLSNRNQLRLDRARRLQHVADFPTGNTTSHATQNNSLRNNSISKRDTDSHNGMLDKSK